jgi:hypothetical protein
VLDRPNSVDPNQIEPYYSLVQIRIIVTGMKE